MSTGTAHIQESGSPRTRRRTTWLLVLGVVAAVSVAFALLLSYAVTEQNGSDLATTEAWVLVALVSFVPGMLVAATVWLAWSPPGRQAPWLLLVAAAAIGLVMAGVAGAAALGGRSYDEQQRAIAAACSVEDVGVLTGFADYGPLFTGPQGATDGTCQAWVVFPGEDAQGVMATVTTAIAADGWVSSDTTWNEKTFTKGSDVVRVTHLRSDEGTTSVGFTVVDPG